MKHRAMSGERGPAEKGEQCSVSGTLCSMLSCWALKSQAFTLTLEPLGSLQLARDRPRERNSAQKYPGLAWLHAGRLGGPARPSGFGISPAGIAPWFSWTPACTVILSFRSTADMGHEARGLARCLSGSKFSRGWLGSTGSEP